MSSNDRPVHPHVVIRFMACVYARRSVWFGGGLEERGHDLVVPTPAPVDPWNLTQAEREAVLDAALAATVLTGHRRCVVFGPGDVVYVEPDGSRKASDTPPSGGLAL